MSGFNLFEHIKLSEKISNSNMLIENIPIDRIKNNDYNFYQISDVEALANSILLVGLQQPLVVSRKNDEYLIISGHRRFSAIQQIRANPDYENSFETLPCIVASDVSSNLGRIQLILGNSTTRVFSDAEIMLQAKNLTAELKELKASGFELKGRLRDVVAEMLTVSPTKLARLNVINKNADKEVLEDFVSGNISESEAYAKSKKIKTNIEPKEIVNDFVENSNSNTVDFKINQNYFDFIQNASMVEVASLLSRANDEFSSFPKAMDFLGKIKIK